MKILVGNALVPPPGKGGMLVSPPYPVEEATSFLSRVRRLGLEVVSAVGHPATAKLLGLEPSRAELVPEEGDIMLVVRLKRRAASPGDVDVSPEDLEVRLVRYGPAACDSFWCMLVQNYHPVIVAEDLENEVLRKKEV